MIRAPNSKPQHTGSTICLLDLDQAHPLRLDGLLQAEMRFDDLDESIIRLLGLSKDIEINPS